MQFFFIFFIFFFFIISIGIITHQGHISQVSVNAHSVTTITSRASGDANNWDDKNNDNYNNGNDDDEVSHDRVGAD